LNYPSSYDFGNVKVGHKKSVTFMLSNSAQEGPPITFASPVAFSIKPVNHPQVFGFAGSATTCPLQLKPNTECNLTVEFIPTASGAASATLTINDNAANAPQIIHLNGFGG
jgi:hypothetical protein